MSAPVDVLAVLDELRGNWRDESQIVGRLDSADDLDAVRAAVAELIEQNAHLVEMCDELMRVNNKTLGRGAVRIQFAIIERFKKKLESSRSALARVKGGMA